MTSHYRGRRYPDHLTVQWYYGRRVTTVPAMALGELGPGSTFDWGEAAAGTAPSLRLAFALAFHHARRSNAEDPVEAAHRRYRDLERLVVSRLAHGGWRLTPQQIDNALHHATKELNR